jgi:alkylhydroperoxidase family enzyme
MTKPVAWIETVAEADAEGPLKALYDKARDPRAGVVDNIMKVHSLHPDTLSDHLELYVTTMRKASGVTRAEREMIAVVVSGINACHY